MACRSEATLERLAMSSRQRKPRLPCQLGWLARRPRRPACCSLAGLFPGCAAAAVALRRPQPPCTLFHHRVKCKQSLSERPISELILHASTSCNTIAAGRSRSKWNGFNENPPTEGPSTPKQLRHQPTWVARQGHAALQQAVSSSVFRRVLRVFAKISRRLRPPLPHVYFVGSPRHEFL